MVTNLIGNTLSPTINGTVPSQPTGPAGPLVTPYLAPGSNAGGPGVVAVPPVTPTTYYPPLVTVAFGANDAVIITSDGGAAGVVLTQQSTGALVGRAVNLAAGQTLAATLVAGGQAALTAAAIAIA
jgi:hypothetical protein